MSALDDLLLQQTQEIVYTVKITGDQVLGTIQLFSIQTGTLLGFDSQEFTDNPHLWFSLIHPEDIDNVKSITQSAFEKGKPELRNYRVRHKSSRKYYWIEERIVSKYDSTGKVVGYLSTAHDITGRKTTEQTLKASETRYRRLFETAQEGILILDATTGQVTEVNPFLVEMLGHTREMLLGKKVWEIIPFKDRKTVQATFTAFHKNGPIRYDDLILATKGGRRIPVEYESYMYEVDDEKVIQCNIRDINKREHCLEKRESLISQLKSARAKGKKLPDMVSICASCKKIKNDEGSWSQFESYIIKYFDICFTHSICPECVQKLYPDFYKTKRNGFQKRYDKG